MNFSVNVLVGAVAVIFVLGGVTGIWWRSELSRTRASYSLFCALFGSLATAYMGFYFWLQQPLSPSPGQEIAAYELPADTYSLGPDFYADHLSAFFLILTGLLSAGVTIYSFSWLAGKREQHRIAGIYNFFVLSSVLFLIANNLLYFLLLLECMTLAFSYLTLYKHNELMEQERLGEKVAHEEITAAKTAFRVYLIYGHAGTLLVAVALLLLALQTNSFDFDTFRQSGGQSISAAWSSVIFLLALAGLGIKGGFAPAHSWVAIVHPRSPTTTHALTLGLLIKVSSFYMLFRLLFEFLEPLAWWGMVLLPVAGLTALTGVFFAITGRDLKTILSNHSVENFGIILAGIGLALLGAAGGRSPELAVLGLAAALYHLLNHTVFKSLLYLCTGAIENRTGTVELEQLGGLIRRLPWTAVAFLAGSLAIAGFPPWNGFVSEWLTLQAALYSLRFLATAPLSFWPSLVVLLVLVMLGLAFGLTALAFAKIAGEALLGKPRQRSRAETNPTGEVSWAMRGPMVALAVLCLGLGALPGLIIEPLVQIATGLLGGPAMEHSVFQVERPAVLTIAAVSANLNWSATLSMIPFFLFSLFLILVAGLVAFRRQRLTRGPVWNGGDEHEAESMQISGSAYTFLTWEWASGRYERAGDSTHPPLPRAWRLPLSADYFARDVFRQLVDTVAGRLVSLCQSFGDLFQGGNIQRYLLYLFLAFLIVLYLSVAMLP